MHRHQPGRRHRGRARAPRSRSSCRPVRRPTSSPPSSVDHVELERTHHADGRTRQTPGGQAGRRCRTAGQAEAPAAGRGSWPRRSWPAAVRIDSGWNCTPSTSSSRWRRPMIVPSSVSAVISSTSGTDVAVDDQRVVAGGLERVGQAGEDAGAVRGGSARSCRA